MTPLLRAAPHGLPGVDDAGVLLVDDQPAKLLSYQAVLVGLDVTITTAGSAREALECLLRRAYAVVLVDVCMPELDGFELAAMIRDHPRFRETAIIFVSGVHLTEFDRLRGYEAGAVDYVPVPIVPEILRAKVGIFVELFRQKRQLERLNRELEGRVAERTAELQDADRRKDEFLAVLSHELRNPLAAIRTASELLSAPAISAECLGQATGVVRRQVTHLVRLIDDLVDVSRITRGTISLQRESVQVSAIIAQAAEATRPLLDTRQHVLTIQIPDPALMVDGDPARLAQVVGNLLNNAAKFTAPGGRIRIDVSQQADCVAICVKDNGIGIAADAVPRIFELFTQLGESRGRVSEGLGIGLALVRRLVEMHEGHVRVHSDGAGHGTEVIVTLPLIVANRPESPAPRGAAAPSLSPHRIIVADDNADAAAALELLLRLRGHDVRTAGDGVEALELVTAFAPRIVLLDLGMPRIDGYEAARRMRQEPNGRDLVLIALTGWGQPQDRERTREAGFDAHLTKPVSEDSLLETISALVTLRSGDASGEASGDARRRASTTDRQRPGADLPGRTDGG
jgi:signal transduction histidine kinase